MDEKLELKKAFATNDHSLLIKKLNIYGIRGVASSWITSYLDKRSQYVCYNDVKSDTLDIACGVPQGSISGPKLSILYINDMVNVSKLFKFIINDMVNVSKLFKFFLYLQMILTCFVRIEILLILVSWYVMN